jgi:hypothetical protein
MKTKILLLGMVVTAFAVTSFAAEPLLSPRAAGNQIKHNGSVDTTTITVDYVDSGHALLSPRAQGNQIRVVKGTDHDVNPARACQKNMIGSPKAVAECSSHTTMPGCMKVAQLK